MATPIELEAIDALRDALSFIDGQARLHQNDGTEIGRKRAETCRQKVLVLYPAYARLAGCEKAPEQAEA